MTPEQARALKAELAWVATDTRVLTAGMDEAALTRRPVDGGWSVAENLQHLLLTADAMLPLAEAAIAELERSGRQAGGAAGLGFMGWLLLKMLEPPPRMRSRTTPSFEPVSAGDALTLVHRLELSNHRLSALITRATGLATSAAKVASPFNTRVKYNVYAAFLIMLCHTRRHLWQAQAAKSGLRETSGACLSDGPTGSRLVPG